MNKIAVSFSHSSKSMQYRGLKLLDSLIHFDSIINMKTINLPVCYSNQPDGKVPNAVNKFNSILQSADILFFAVPESAGHYSAVFKNAMDWLIVLYRFNSQLGRGYSMTNKPLYLLTFTPTHKNAGGRHFSMTKSLLEKKFGAKVRQTYVFNRCWDYLLPGNQSFVAKEAKSINNDITDFNFSNYEKSIHTKTFYEVDMWLEQYNRWDEKWKSVCSKKKQ